MEDILIYLHIPKTGGTTLRDIIQRQYKTQKILTIPRLEKSMITIEDLSSKQKNEINVIQGHLQYGIHNNLNRNAKYFAIM